jgi:outer membrane receptor protein involved in Fe transport
LHSQYFNVTPRVMLNYTPNQSTSLNFSYRTWALQPGITQLAPIENNNDPLHITLGNPGLQPAFNQNLRLEFHRFKTWMINIIANLGFISNSLSTKTTTDSLGRQISQPVNVDGARTTGINFSIDRKLGDLDLGFHSINSFSRTVNYINADLCQNNAYTISGGISLGKYVANKYSFKLNTNFTYFDQFSNINLAAPVRYWVQNHSGAISLFFLRNFEINTNATYSWQQRTVSFPGNTSILLWNAYIGRNFLSNRVTINFVLNNILNKNAGITRSNITNANTESSTNILGRYWMVSATYRFDKKLKQSK